MCLGSAFLALCGGKACPEKQRTKTMFFSYKTSLDLPKSRRQGRFWEPLKKSKMVTPSELYLTMAASKKPAYLRGLRFVVAAKKRIIDGMVHFWCAAQLTKLDKIILIFSPSPGILGTEFCNTLDMLPVHRMPLRIHVFVTPSTHNLYIWPPAGGV